jgi:hypothetical protein
MFEIHTPKKHMDNSEWVSLAVYNPKRETDGPRCNLCLSRKVGRFLGERALILKGTLADANTAMLVSSPDGFKIRPNNGGSSYFMFFAAKRFGIATFRRATGCAIIGGCGVYEGKNAIRFVLPVWAREPIDRRIMGTYIADWGVSDD